MRIGIPMANIGGYRAVLEAAHLFGRFLQGRLLQPVKYHRLRYW